MSSITKSNFKFITDLSKNNNRDWFNENKAVYQEQHENIIQFADELLALMNEHDNIETPTGKKSLFRIYRDVRFSKDKSPYKTHWSGGFKRATKLLRGGYYFHLQPGGNSFIGGGFWGPNKEDLLRIREELAVDASEMRDIITDKDFVDTFGGLEGEQLKTAPKGFDKEHPDIDLLRYKQFIFGRNFTDDEVLDPNFVNVANETFKKMRPFFDYMSEVLTTDANGEPLY
jgi:uncharacterized protein (TIGR02453 family)